MELRRRSGEKKSAKATNFRNRVTILAENIDSSRVYRKLKLQQEFLEKSITSIIKTMKIDSVMICEIIDIDKKYFSQRQMISHTLGRCALEVVEELKCLKSMVQQPDPIGIQNLDVSDCKSRLTKLSNQIEAFRTEKNLDKLKEEEVTLETDLRELERRFLIVEKPVNGIPKWFNDKKKFIVRNEPSDQFVELVARTGHTQGWTEEDHSLFLKIRKKCNSVPQLVTEFRGRRCHLTNEEVINHEAWYKLYSELREKQKKEIAEWRLRKDSEEPKLDNRPKDHEEVISRVKSSSNSGEEKQKNIEKKRMLDEWKAEKARKSAMDDEQNKRLEIERAEKKKRSRDTLRRKVQIKPQDNEVQEEGKKWSSESNLHKEVDKKCKKINSTWLIKSFREQDEKFVQRRLNFLKASQKEEDQKELPKREETGFSKSRSLSTTLFASTKGWEEKCKSNKKMEKIFGVVNYVKDIQKLAVQRL